MSYNERHGDAPERRYQNPVGLVVSFAGVGVNEEFLAGDAERGRDVLQVAGLFPGVGEAQNADVRAFFFLLVFEPGEPSDHARNVLRPRPDAEGGACLECGVHRDGEQAAGDRPPRPPVEPPAPPKDVR